MKLLLIILNSFDRFIERFIGIRDDNNCVPLGRKTNALVTSHIPSNNDADVFVRQQGWDIADVSLTEQVCMPPIIQLPQKE